MGTYYYSKAAEFKLEDKPSGVSNILTGLLLIAILAIMILFSKLSETNKQVSDLQVLSGAFAKG